MTRATAGRIGVVLLAALAVVCTPVPAIACTPILPLTMLFMGPVVALPVTIVLKSVVFAAFERSVPWYRAVLAMALANVISTIPAIGLLVGFTVPTFFLGSLFVVYGVSIGPARRLVRLLPGTWFGRRTADELAGLVLLLYLAMTVAFGLAQLALDASDGSVAAYWALKVVWVELGVVLAFVLTTLWEEWAVARVLGQRAGPQQNLLTNVVRANVVVGMMVAGAAALAALPERILSPGFLLWARILEALSARA